MATNFLRYSIYLTDPIQVAALQTLYPSGIQQAPDGAGGASASYAAPLQLENTPFKPPCVRSPWFTGEANIPRSVPQFTRAQGGWFGLATQFPAATLFVWLGVFTFAPPLAPHVVNGSARTIMAQRYWADGFELPDLGEGGADAGASLVSRMASRHLSGYGLGFRNTTVTKTHTVTEFGAAATTHVWERIYFRPRAFPTAASRIWRCHGATSNAAGVALDLLPGGLLQLSNIDNVGTEVITGNDLAGGAPVLLLPQVWSRLDILYQYGISGPNSPINAFTLYLNGARVFVVNAFPTGVGLSQVQNAQGSTIGGGPALSMALDADDWIGADWPSPADQSFWNGSRVALLGATGFAATHDALWTGDWRLTRQRPISNNPAQLLTNSTTVSRLAVTTDAAAEVDACPCALGYVALTVGLYSQRAVGALSGTLGTNLPGLPLTAITQGTTLSWASVMYRPSGLLDPLTTLAPLELWHQHGADSQPASVQSLLATAELLGVFGQEDILTTVAGGSGQIPAVAVPLYASPKIGVQNAPYPRTAWATIGVLPPSPLVLVAGTYVGNAGFQDLLFRVPFHFLYIRPLSGNTGGIQWFASSVAPHAGGALSYAPDSPPQIQIDPGDYLPPDTLNVQQQRTIMRLAGGNAQSNANGVTYAYFAFCDPGARFLSCGTTWDSSLQSDVVSQLDNALFTPEAGFFQQEQFGTTTTVSFYFKGIGHAANAISRLDTAQLASALQWSQGSIRSHSSFHIPGSCQISYAIFRRDDGSGEACAVLPLQLITYIGDGTGPRTIALTPASGKRPLWALVVPHDAASVQRDPAHTGTVSTQFPATDLANSGITGGGIDFFTVGSALNVLNSVYDVIVFPGDTTAGNNGWSVGGEFFPCAPKPPSAPPPPIYPPPPPTPPPVPSGCLDPQVASAGSGSGCGATLGPGADSGAGSGCRAML